MKKYGFLIRFFLKLAILMAVSFLIWTYIFCFYRVSGNNMFPNMKDGDLVFLYKLEDYYNNDVVLYKTDNKMKLGRIVATAGQTVDFPEEGGYTVNDYLPSEEITYETANADSSDIIYPLTIENDSAYVLNDFRTDQKDSRIYGTISKEDIVGKVFFILRRRSF